MILHVDIVGIGNKKVSTPKFEMETLNEYLTIAEKMIGALAPSIKYGLAEEMLNSDDAISNVAHDIMLADWQFNGRGNRFGFRKDRARYSIKSYLGRKSKNNSRQIFRLDNIINSSASDTTFLDFITDDSCSPSDYAENKDHQNFILKKLDEMVQKGIVSEKGIKYIKMFYLEGISVASIAKKEGVTRQAVHDMMSRTMKIIKNSLKRQLN
jgi:hypothetical protein